jgi:TetR/AcrR family transcriptional repressor of nem operon
VKHWAEMTGGVFVPASYHALQDPLHRLLGYVSFRKELLRGKVPDFTCMVGMIVQEVYETHPHLRAACETSISDHAETLEPTIAEAMKKLGIKN